MNNEKKEDLITVLLKMWFIKFSIHFGTYQKKKEKKKADKELCLHSSLNYKN